jgi:predicted permease
MRGLENLWRNLVQRKRAEEDLDLELRAAFDLLVDEKLRSGMTREAARRAARLELGSADSLKEDVRDARAGASLDALLQDVRYALRLFRRAPGFTAVAVLTLALGVGLNAAMFGVVKSVLLDALPYADADRLMRIAGRFRGEAQAGALLRSEQVDGVVRRQRSFESLAAFDSARDAVYGDDGEMPRLVTTAWVQPGLFDTIGVRAALGRTFHDDDRAIGYVPISGDERGTDSARAVVITHEAWQRFFAGDPAVIGREVRINGVHRSVIGVLPFGFVGLAGQAEFYLAFDIAPTLTRGSGWLRMVGRLKPGVSFEAADAEVAAIWADERPGETGVRLQATPLRDALVGRTRGPLIVLLASAAFVLLIACANLTAALLSRGLLRRKELSVRAALGAGRRRLMRQLLTESALLGLLGGAVGLLLAQWLLALLRGLARPVLPAHAELSLDTGALFAMAALALGAGLLFGSAPALSIGRSDEAMALHDRARGASEGQRPRRLRGMLVAGQMALCASLLAGAFLLSRSLWEMARLPLGFDAHGVLTARFRLSTAGYPTLEKRARFREELTERLRRLPGVDAVATANKVPAVESPRRDGFSGPPESTLPFVEYASVSDDYFRALRIPVLAGRTFDESDREGAPGTAVINESLRRRYWPEGAIGAQIRLGGDPVTVIGVVGDVRNDLANPVAAPMAYRSHRQESTYRFCVLLRARVDPASLLPLVEREAAALDPALPLQQGMTLLSALGDGLASRRLPVILIAAFSALSLLLASIGIYALFGSMAAAREREFGVRLALGSRPGEIALLMLRQGGSWMAAGLAGGVPGVLLVARLLRGWLYGVPPLDPIAVLGAALLLVGCAAVALLIPVRRAARCDPLLALRAE